MMRTLTPTSTWVVAADAYVCRIYDFYRQPEHFFLVKEITHPENKLKSKDLTADRSGSRPSGKAGRSSAYEQISNPKGVHIDNFSREIAKALDDGRISGAYRELIIALAPKMNGMVGHHMNKRVKDLVSHNISKDLTHMEYYELFDYLCKYIG